jgi:hypothetical protein
MYFLIMRLNILHTMNKNFLITILVSLMWSNISNAEVIFDKWKINANEAAVRVEKLGESDLSGAFTYALLKENNKCDLMTIYFSSMSNGKYDLKELLGLKIPIKINGMGPIEAMIANTRPAFDAKTIATLDLSKEQIDEVKNLQNVTIQIGDPRPIDGYDFENVAGKITIDFVKVDEFDPSEYFSNLSTTWNLNKNRAAVDKGRSICDKIKEDKNLPVNNKANCIAGDCANGTGVFKYKDGSKYTGKFKNGKRHGQGSLEMSDGTIYTGLSKADVFSGEGTILYSTGDKYVGEIQNNKRNGQGAYTFKNGLTSIGEWKNNKTVGSHTIADPEKVGQKAVEKMIEEEGVVLVKVSKTYDNGHKYEGTLNAIDEKRHGKGKYTTPDGSVYEGEFKNGDKHGQGTYFFASGSKYIGQWINGRRSGEGTYTHPDGSKYIGLWENDMRNGKGVSTFSNGKKYTGEFKDDKMHGQGIHTFSDGTRYVGESKDDLWHGVGKLSFSSGHFYFGEFKKSSFNGQGTLTYADGSVYHGGFKNDIFDGQGTHTLANGSKYVGGYKNGKYNGYGVMTRSDDGKVYSGIWEDGKLTK